MVTLVFHKLSCCLLIHIDETEENWRSYDKDDEVEI